MARPTREDLISSNSSPAAVALVSLASGKNPDGTDFSLAVTNSPGLAVERQRFYWAGTGRLTVAAAGNFRATLANPAGSGRNLNVVRLITFGTVRNWLNFYVNPTAGLPAATKTVNNAIVDAPAGVGVLSADTDTVTALSGGTDTGIALGAGPDQRIVSDLAPIVLTPGVALGMNASVGAAADMSINLFWYETDV